MGYCYTADGKLCCDVCDHSGGVRKFRCPFGYCQAVALCPKCKHEHPEYVTKAFHRKQGCEKNHNEFARQEAERASLIERGQFVRTSALWHPQRPGDNIKVIFQGRDRTSKAFWMSDKTYHAIPFGVNATPKEYRKHGAVAEARSLDIYDAEITVKGGEKEPVTF